jgi:hypothetical protein
MKSILTIGGAVFDIFIEQAHPISGHYDAQQCIILPEGKKLSIETRSTFSGGCATNSAVAFKRLGFKVSSFFKVGADEAGQFILNELRTDGICIDHAIITESANTGTSYIIQSPSGNHALLVDRGAHLTLVKEELPLEEIKNNDFLYVTSLSGSTGTLLPEIARVAHKDGVPVATNPGTSQLKENIGPFKESLPMIDILILNALEASILFHTLLGVTTTVSRPNAAHLAQEFIIIQGKSYSLKDYFKILLSHGVSTAVVTNGAEGVYVANKEGIIFCPSIKTPNIISTVGAGDAFASCFVAMIAQGKSIELATCAGVINSASILHYLGAKTGLLTAQELEERLAVFDKSVLQKI